MSLTLKQLIENEHFLLHKTCISLTDDVTILADKITYDELLERLKNDLAEYASRTVIATDWYWSMELLVDRLVIHISRPLLKL